MEAKKLFPNLKNPLEIKIPAFEGPLDLLLHLIKINELSIEDVILSELTSSYLEYLNLLKSINLDTAGEFIDIAATLILIKSKKLLPKNKLDNNEFNSEENPEEILRLRLMEYQKYKEISFKIGSRDILGRDLFTRPEKEEFISDRKEALPRYLDVTISELMEAFKKIIEKSPKIKKHFVENDNLNIEDRFDDLIEQFNIKKRIIFDELFIEINFLSFKILTFLAILEMVKLNIIKIVQLKNSGPIHLIVSNNFDDNVKKWYKEQSKEIKILKVS